MKRHPNNAAARRGREGACVADPCSVGRFIRNHCKTLIQLATDKLPSYNMGNEATKCLNSAVMLAYLLFDEAAIKYTEFCDVDNVKKRYGKKQGHENISSTLARRLAVSLKDAGKTSGKELYYVMLTDGYMTRPGDDTTKIYEPGHVFLIERFAGDACEDKLFEIYQSYIHAYDLDEYALKAQYQPRDQHFLNYIADELVHLFTTDTWDKRCSTFWRTFTLAPGEQFEGYRPKGAMMLCYIKFPLENCTGSMRKVLTEALRKASSAAPDEIYGDDEERYKSMKSRPLTNREMIIDIKGMLADLP